MPDDTQSSDKNEPFDTASRLNKKKTSESGMRAQKRPQSKRHATAESDASVYGGRTPPYDVDAEQGLLSAIIMAGGGDVLSDCQMQKITSETFFRTEHQIIFEAISNLSESGKPIETLSIAHELRRLGKLEDIGGVQFVENLANKAATTLYASHWCEIVKEKYFRRKLIMTAAKAAESAFSDSDDIKFVLDRVEKSFLDIASDSTQDSVQVTSKKSGIVESAMWLLHSMRKNHISGITSGFPDLDTLTLGFHPGQMIVVAARPGMGKTSIGLNFIEAALFDKSYQDKPSRNILLFSLEMTKEDLIMRLLASRARVDLRNIQRGYGQKDDIEKLNSAKNEYETRNLFIDDVGGQTILEIRAKARRIHNHHPLDMIVIDYLQLINGMDSRLQREQQIAEASRAIKAMAKEFNVPVIALAQLNRESEREARTPRLSDLRESGSIEQDADVVMLIDIKRRGGAKKSDAEEDEDKGKTVRDRTLIIAKQRNGPMGEINLHFHSDLTRFETPAKGEAR